MTASYPNLGWFIDALLRHDPKDVAIVECARYRRYPFSYGALRDRVRRSWRLLSRLGLRPGDRMLLWGPNGADWIALLFAGLQSGLVVVPVDVQASEELIGRIAEQTQARLLFTNRPGDRTIQTVLFSELPELLSGLEPVDLPIANVGHDALAEIVYTSGTTGVPKGVMLTHRNILSNLEALDRTVLVPFALRMVSTLPLSHMLEQVVGLFFLLGKGCAVIYPDTLRPTRLARIVRREKAWGMMTVPGMLQSLRAYCERSGQAPWRVLGPRFRVLGAGGAALPEALERWWTSHWTLVVQGYGLTETASALASNTLGRRKTGSIGRPLPGVDVRLGDEGEIQTRGGNVTPGYYGMPEKTAELFTPDGWFRTGDIGELRDGDIYFKGRKKDVIVTSSGLNVYPEDVEHVVDALDGVQESCIVERDDKVWAVLCLQPGAKADDVVRRANARLGSHQQIMGFSLWADSKLPRTALGKIRKFEVRKRIIDQEDKKGMGSVAVLSGPVLQLLSRIVRLDPTDATRGALEDRKLSELGVDSLRRVELLSSLEEEFGAELEDTAITGETTIAELERLAAGTRLTIKSELPTWQFGIAAAAVRWILQPLAHRVIEFFSSPEAQGLEQLDSVKPPVIFVANHQSAWDGAIVARFIPRKFQPLAIPALPDFFGMPSQNTWGAALVWRLMGYAIGVAFRCYPFGPAAGMERCFEFTGRRLDAGDNILIFPEGGRTPDGSIQPFFGGIGIMAREMRATIVPVRLEGLHEILPYPRFVVPLKRGRSRVVFGGSISLPADLPPDVSAKRIQDAVERLA